MFRHIIVTLDGSTWAEAALPPACDLAKQLGLPVILLRVADLGIDADVPGTTRRHHAEVESYIAQVVARLVADGFDATGKVVDGYPAAAIAAEAKKYPDALLVAATHARSEFGKLIHGSVAEQLVRLCPAVLLIHAE
jgi:nucleotide-binding universal stress UspA family protein